ncbi:MAG TPA: hypothetical protein HA218_01750 [Nanoarchaeota archaeon]|nr:hypothetical protein [Nanoarchaeota archaeon]
MVQTETKEEKPIVVDKPFRLLEVNVEPRYDSNHERSFTGGEVRNEIKKIFEPSATYHLFTTAANPKAKERLDEIAREETRTKEHSHSRFGSDLTYLYQYALHAFAGKEGIVHAYFDLVDQNCHMGDRLWDTAYLPTVHIVRGNEAAVDALVDLVGKLNSDEAYAIIKKREAPQNYHMGAVDALREASRGYGIDPILVSERQWRNVQGETLKNAVDFLCQFTYSEKFRDHSSVWD